MELNHIDLQVSDVARTLEFFETFFDFHCTYQRKGQIAILEDEAGFSLGLSNLFNSPPLAYPPDFHVGFVLEKESEVHAMYKRLKSAGMPMKAEISRGTQRILYVSCPRLYPGRGPSAS